MRFLGFFKTNKPRQFNYNPVFYNQRLHELNEKIHKINVVGPTTIGKVSIGITRGSMRRNAAYALKNRKNSTLTILAIITFLLMVSYFFLKP